MTIESSPPTQPAAAPSHAMWHVYAEFGRERVPEAAAGIVATLVGRFVGLLPPFVLGLAIDAVLLADRPFGLPGVPGGWLPTDPVAQLGVAVGVIAAAYLLSAVFAWVQNWGWNAFAQAVQHALRVDAYDSMQGLAMAFFDDRQTGELLSVLNNDVNQLEEFLTDGLNAGL
ncbi:MAG TPA: ABC transporter transmembrane domain-containing protein, partial [Halobacteriales archaeon]|nr:ABC transporter transmembrane domain-containing protein [Halobacteriales archaeon]